MNFHKLPAGVQDVLPGEYYNLSLLEERLKEKFRLAGCRFVQSSALEYYDTSPRSAIASPREICSK